MGLKFLHAGNLTPDLGRDAMKLKRNLQKVWLLPRRPQYNIAYSYVVFLFYNLFPVSEITIGIIGNAS